MTLKPLFKFLYVIYPFAVGLSILTVLQIINPELIYKLDTFQLLGLMFLLNLLVMLFLKFIKGIVFGKNDTLAGKMRKCPLIKQYGLNYCVECPESYTCPKGV